MLKARQSAETELNFKFIVNIPMKEKAVQITSIKISNSITIMIIIRHFRDLNTFN